MYFRFRLRLVVNDGMAGVFFKHGRGYLSAQITIDACLVNKEVSGNILGIGAFGIGHKEIVTRKK